MAGTKRARTRGSTETLDDIGQQQQQSKNAPSGSRKQVAEEKSADLANSPDACPHLPVRDGVFNGSYPTLVCSIDAKTIVRGDCDGILTVSDVKTGYIHNTFNTRTGPVKALDVWSGYVVSLGEKWKLTVCRLDGCQLQIITAETLHSRPVDIKLVKMRGDIYVATVDHKPNYLNYYALKDPFRYYWSISLPETVPDSFICQKYP